MHVRFRRSCGCDLLASGTFWVIMGHSVRVARVLFLARYSLYHVCKYSVPVSRAFRRTYGCTDYKKYNYCVRTRKQDHSSECDWSISHQGCRSYCVSCPSRAVDLPWLALFLSPSQPVELSQPQLISKSRRISECSTLNACVRFIRRRPVKNAAAMDLFLCHYIGRWIFLGTLRNHMHFWGQAVN